MPSKCTLYCSPDCSLCVLSSALSWDIFSSSSCAFAWALFLELSFLSSLVWALLLELSCLSFFAILSSLELLLRKVMDARKDKISSPRAPGGDRNMQSSSYLPILPCKSMSLSFRIRNLAQYHKKLTKTMSTVHHLRKFFLWTNPKQGNSKRRARTCPSCLTLGSGSLGQGLGYRLGLHNTGPLTLGPLLQTSCAHKTNWNELNHIYDQYSWQANPNTQFRS